MRPALPFVPRQDYRDAMARLGAAVNVITTDGPGGRAGFTASAVCSVTDEPPTLLVCLNRGASVYESFRANGVVAVNVLGHGQQALSNLFGGKTPSHERFAAGHWHAHVTGAPLLDSALVAFDCRVVDSNQIGTHDILFCEVVAIRHGEPGQGLMYFERAYHALGG